MQVAFECSLLLNAHPKSFLELFKEAFMFVPQVFGLEQLFQVAV